MRYVKRTGGFVEDHGDSVTLYRVFVGDHADAKITAFDLNAPDHRWSFDTTGQSKLYAVNEGAAIVAVQSDDNVVNFIDSGISLHSHGDHSDIDIEAPVALKENLTGPRPFHIIDHDGKVVINFDKGGYAKIVDASELHHGELETSQLKQEPTRNTSTQSTARTSKPIQNYLTEKSKPATSNLLPSLKAEEQEELDRLWEGSSDNTEETP